MRDAVADPDVRVMTDALKPALGGFQMAGFSGRVDKLVAARGRAIAPVRRRVSRRLRIIARQPALLPP